GPGGHSIFTWTLLQGLDGRADLNGDGYITASELATYVGPAVSSLSHQTPAFGTLVGSKGGEFVFEIHHEGEFLSEESTQLDKAAIDLNGELERVKKLIAEKAARNAKLKQELASAQAQLAQIDPGHAAGGRGPAPVSSGESAKRHNDEGMRLY